MEVVVRITDEQEALYRRYGQTGGVTGDDMPLVYEFQKSMRDQVIAAIRLADEVSAATAEPEVTQ